MQIGIVISHRGIHPRVQLLNSNNFNSTSSSSNKEHAIFWITAQCLGMDPTIQRPLTSTHLSIAQYNIQDGAFPLTSSSGSTSSSNKNMVNGRVNRGDKLIEWLTMQANAGTMFIGICELSHWEHLANKADVVKNLPILVTRAASVGYSHSHMTPLPYYEHPPQLRTANPIASSAAYPVGFLSVLPFTVVKEIIAPTFQRNALHIYIAEVDLHVWIVHLHAHSVIQRVAEVQVLLKENAMLLKQKAKIVIMGDFNTLSPHDRLQHDDDKIVSMIQDRPTDSVMTRWKKKYLNAAGDKIDYSPMELLLM